MARHVSHLGEIKNVKNYGQKNLKGKALGRPRHRWKIHIEMDLNEIGWMWTGFMWLRLWTGVRLL
jgi:hypothetical protein